MNSEAAHSLRQAFASFESGDWDDALREGAHAHSLAPSQPDVMLLMAVVCMQAGRPALANGWFEQALSAAPDRADIHSNYANALWEQGRIDDAIIHCERAIALDDSKPEAFNVMGNLWMDCDQYSLAANCFRKALSLRENYPHAANNLGNALTKVNELDAAIVAYRNAVLLDENYYQAWRNLGHALKLKGSFSEAAICFERSLLIEPNQYGVRRLINEVSPRWLKGHSGRTLALACYEPKHAQFLKASFSDGEFTTRYNRNLLRPHSIAQLETKLSRLQGKHPCQTNAVDWVIERQRDGQPIGLASMVEISFAHQRAELLIGIPDTKDLAPGAGLEATLLVMDFAFNQVGLNKLTSIVYGDNLIAQKNTVSLGFQCEGKQLSHIWDDKSIQYLDVFNNGMTKAGMKGNARLSRLSQRLLGWDVTKDPS